MKRFYPSCNFARIDIEAYRRLNEYARSRGLEVAKCCLKDKKDAEEGDEGYYICQACRPNVEKHGYDTISLWKLMDEDESFVFPDYSGLKVTVQDCWRDREHPEIYHYIRSLLTKMHVEVEELEGENFTDTQFCGRFHVDTKLYAEELAQYPDVGLLTNLPGDLFVRLMQEQAAKFHGGYALVYCNTCYNNLKQGGANVIHIAQLVMNLFEMGREH